MKALISPQENNRIAQVSPEDFPIAPPLFWVDCPEDITTEWTYDDSGFQEPVVPEVVTPPAPTVEDLLAQLQVIQAQIANL